MSEDNKKQALAEKDLGNQAYKKKEFEQALAHYSKAFELDGTNISFLTNKAAVYYEQGKYNECIKECEKAIEINQTVRADYQLVARAYQRIGNAYVKLEDLDNAIKYYEKSLTNHRTPDTLGKLRETEKLKKQREKEAYRDPKKADEARELGNTYFKQRDWPKAISAYSEAILRNEDDPRPYSNRSACYLKMMAIPEAKKDALKCIELDPTFGRGYIRKAAVEFSMREYQQSIDTLMEAKQHDKDGKLAREIEQQLRKSAAAMYVPAAGAEGEKSEEEIREAALKNPEIQRILSDPVMQQILQQMQSDPRAAQEHLKNPQVANNIRKLMNAGILRVG
ncbi:hypothetical protein BX666DRAFT_1977173 [Dichotomocladium elegans]|nr:hypothetical protein BX666DRAFT_1977173 [Dichotomocladium elegans]